MVEIHYIPRVTIATVGAWYILVFPNQPNYLEFDLPGFLDVITLAFAVVFFVVCVLAEFAKIRSTIRFCGVLSKLRELFGFVALVALFHLRSMRGFGGSCAIRYTSRIEAPSEGGRG